MIVNMQSVANRKQSSNYSNTYIYAGKACMYSICGSCMFVPVLQPLEAEGALEELARQPLVAAHAADGGCSGGAVNRHR